METASDKEWAQKYLLDPLTAPEPSQIHALEAQTSKPRHSNSVKSNTSHSATLRKQRPGDRTPASSTTSKTGFSHNNSNPHTPPPSASPTSSSFHPTNPFSDQYTPPTPSRHAANRTNSDKSDSSAGSGSSGNARTPPSSFDRRPRASSALSPREPTHHRSSSTSNGTGSNHRNLLASLPQRSASSGGNKHHHQHQRNTSLTQRFPGDMSHRPLDMIKRETKIADRHPHHRSSHRRHRSAASQTDTIDALDTIGGSYHHGGPYDATLYSRNIHEKYSPLAAVRDSNMEAIRATPREFIEDSLQKHVPLQGTATVPNGGYDLSGKRMDYREGADLMREPDAAGGAYKRWDGMQYHPDDLKGKGEPSYTLERDIRKMKQRDGLLHPEGIEMTAPFRPRSRSHGVADASGAHAHSSGLGVHRSNTTGKSGSSKLSEGLKRRFGSIRKKKDLPIEAVQ